MCPPGVEWTKVTCAYCSKVFEIAPAFYRTRMRLSKSGKLFCGKVCSGDWKSKLAVEKQARVIDLRNE